jgi:hypothetical protein
MPTRVTGAPQETAKRRAIFAEPLPTDGQRT